MNDMDVFNELIKREPDFLDKPIEELLPIYFLGKASVAAYKSLIPNMPNMGMAIEQQKRTLADGQNAGKLVLAIEGQVGKMLPSAEEAKRVNKRGKRVNPDGTTRIGGGEPTLPAELGDTPAKRSHAAINARAIANNPAVVEEVEKEAEENNDIATRTAVLNKIKLKKEIERQKEAEKNREENKSLITLEQAEYINKLERVVALLPTSPPKDWNETAIAHARGLAKIIMKRLEVFV